MLKKFTTFTALFVFAVVGMLPSVVVASQEADIENGIVLSALPATAATRGATPELLTSIIAWLSENYDLPATQELPRVELAAPMKITAMRYKGLMPDRWREDSIRDPAVQAAHQREVVAVYNDKTRTIVLPQNWNGAEPVQRSILVHEMVHHLQNLAKLKYECPAAREKLAYEAQSDWLKLHGLDLEKEFDVDLFTIFVTSACMN